MSSNKPPQYCHPTAFAWFQESLRTLDTTDGLVRATVAISRHRLADADPEKVLQQLDAFADQVNGRVRNRSTQALLAHLHAVLFDEAEFRGNANEYYHPRNSFLPAVLESRQGIPITLVLIYKAVAERVGIPVQGLNCPAHFLAEVVADDERLLVDPFHRGITLSYAEARERLEQLSNAPLPDDAHVFSVATHAQWLARILRNLQNVFSMTGNSRDLQAMSELLALLEGPRLFG
jgi:regulator of sirC expression with transglutaminase-like and TPR domain